jgi:hypothetical protein
MKTYQHTQPATMILKCMVAMIAISAMLSTVIHPLILTAIILVIVAWIFRSMTIEISDSELAWYFGSGFPRRRVPLSEIVSAEPIRTSAWNGWGIHYTTRGWLYNVSGYDAVLITLRNGKRFCLGTDEPQELARELTKNAR